MGCGASKGKADGADANTQNADITFKTTSCRNMDDFFNQAQSVIQSFKDLTAPLNEQKDNFYDVTGFWEVCGTSKQRKGYSIPIRKGVNLFHLNNKIYVLLVP